jgi:hypothetical protein
LQGGPVLQRVRDRMCAVLHAELGQDRLDVVANGLRLMCSSAAISGLLRPAASRSNTWR